MRVTKNDSRYTTAGIRRWVTASYHRFEREERSLQVWDKALVTCHQGKPLELGELHWHRSWPATFGDCLVILFLGDALQLGEATQTLEVLFYDLLGHGIPLREDLTDSSWVYKLFPEGLPLKPIKEPLTREQVRHLKLTKRLKTATKMLACWERRSKLANTKIKSWTKRLNTLQKQLSKEPPNASH